MERMQEADLVRESLYVLQGLPSAVRRLEHLSAVYLATEADIRALRAAGTIWNRTASSNAVGKLLLEFADAGRVRCCLDLFVKFFLDEKPCFSTLAAKRRSWGCSGSIAFKAHRKQVKELQRKRWGAYRQVKLASRGLVNQAFAKAVRSILLAHTDALSTLLDSVSTRRSESRKQGFDPRFKNGKDGAEGPVEARDMTLLELHLHTKELRSQLQALASICFSHRDSNPGWTSDFLCGELYVGETAYGRRGPPTIDQLVVIFSQWHDFLLVVQDFPRGATLLSYLYSKLLDADSLQAKVLRFLFARSWQPYSVFVESWIYLATVTDPYAEFFVEQCLSNSGHLFSLEQGLPSEVKIRGEASMPSFLREVSVPLIRAGQQLQVLLKLPETRDFAQQLAGYIFLTNPRAESQEIGGSFWSEHNRRSSLFSTLGFSEQNLDKGLQLREEKIHVITEHFNQLFEALMSRAEASRKDEEDNSTDQLMADSSTGDLFCDSFSEFQLEEVFKSDSPGLSSMSMFMEIGEAPSIALKDLQTSFAEKGSCNIRSHDDHPGVGKESESDVHSEVVLTSALPSDAQTEHQSTVFVPRILVSELPAQRPTEYQVTDDKGLCDPNSLDCRQLRDNGGLNDTEAVLCLSGVTAECEDRVTDEVTSLSIQRKSDCPSNGFSGQRSSAPNVDKKVWGHPLPVGQTREVETSAGGTIINSPTLRTSFLDFKELNVELSSLLISGSGNVPGLSNAESLVSDYLVETWSAAELPNNPFMVSSSAHSAAAHMYGFISFSESGKNWDLDAKLVDRGVYAKRYFVQIPRDPLRMERRILAELPYINYTDFPFLDKHLSHGQEKSACPDSSSYTGGLPLHHIEQIMNDKGEAACKTVTLDQCKPSGLAHETRKDVGLGDMFVYLNEALSREGMGRRKWQLEESFIVEDFRTSVPESVQLQSDFEEPLLSGTSASEQTGRENKLGYQTILGSVDGNLDITEDTRKDAESSGPPFLDMHEERRHNEAGNHVFMKENGLQESSYPQFFTSLYLSGGGAQLGSRTSESSADILQAEETDCWIDGEIPFAVVLDKSIIQEILLQYQSVSMYTVKVLQEVLRLRDHYAALRRYFFMETADWADNFVAALSNHRWGLLGGQSEVLALQGILESALQRSSCEGDEFAERLYIATLHADDLSAVPKFGSERPNSFKSIDLGYRVNWPLTIVLTYSSLKRYSGIFSFLVGIKSTVHILSNICQSLKAIRHDLRDEIERSQHQKNCFRMLQVFRWQVCHFVTSLQRYLESKLLYVVWSRFLQATELEEKDIYELEALHADYLNDAENCCFLSKTTTAVKASVDKILLLVFDFDTHLRIASSETGANVLSDLLYSQAFRLNLTFQECMRHLHSCSIRPEFRSSLSDFWMCLDHNGFFAKSCSNYHH